LPVVRVYRGVLRDCDRHVVRPPPSGRWKCGGEGGIP
jgi:hypothetical protein